MWSLQIELLIFMAAGFFAGKKKILNDSGVKVLTDLVINIIIPCSIALSFQLTADKEILHGIILVFVISLLVQIYYFLLNQFLYKRMEEGHQICCKYGTMVTNASFIGLPIITALYGSVGTVYASFFLIPQRLFMWLYGIPLFSGSKSKDGLKSAMLHPCNKAIMIGVLLMILYNCGIILPGVITTGIRMIGSTSTVLSMIVIGYTVSNIDFRSLFSKDIAYYCSFRLILIPLSLLVVMKLLGTAELCRNTCVILSAIPAASTLTMMAQKYEVCPEFAASLTVVSTLLSMLSIPVIHLFL